MAVLRVPREEAPGICENAKLGEGREDCTIEGREYEARELAAKEGRQVKTMDSGPKTIEDAVALYLEDKRQQNCSEETLTKLETLFRKQLLSWAEDKGLRYLVEVTLERLEEFRKSWKDKSPLSRKKKQERVIGFFWFAHRHDGLRKTRQRA